MQMLCLPQKNLQKHLCPLLESINCTNAGEPDAPPRAGSPPAPQGLTPHLPFPFFTVTPRNSWGRVWCFKVM